MHFFLAIKLIKYLSTWSSLTNAMKIFNTAALIIHALVYLDKFLGQDAVKQRTSLGSED